MVNGFVPHSSPYNLPGLFMNFLSLYTYMHQAGHPAAASKKVPYPFPPSTWKTLSNEGGQDIFARFSIYLSLNPSVAGNAELYNIADEAQPRSFADRWSAICSVFGLEGVEPVETSAAEYITPVKFIKKYPEEVEKLREDKGVEMQIVTIDAGLEIWLAMFDFNHDMILDKARATGFTEEIAYQDMWRIVFERYGKAKKVYLG